MQDLQSEFEDGTFFYPATEDRENWISINHIDVSFFCQENFCLMKQRFEETIPLIEKFYSQGRGFYVQERSTRGTLDPGSLLFSFRDNLTDRKLIERLDLLNADWAVESLEEIYRKECELEHSDLPKEKLYRLWNAFCYLYSKSDFDKPVEYAAQKHKPLLSKLFQENPIWFKHLLGKIKTISSYEERFSSDLFYFWVKKFIDQFKQSQTDWDQKLLRAMSSDYTERRIIHFIAIYLLTNYKDQSLETRSFFDFLSLIIRQIPSGKKHWVETTEDFTYLKEWKSALSRPFPYHDYVPDKKDMRCVTVWMDSVHKRISIQFIYRTPEGQAKTMLLSPDLRSTGEISDEKYQQYVKDFGAY